jgi:hypothetical protein
MSAQTKFGFFGLLLVAVLSLPASAQQTVLVPKGALPAYMLGRQIGRSLEGALRAGNELAASKGELTAFVAQARKRFWDNYPNGPEREAAEVEFSKALLAKDWTYLSLYVPQGPLSVRGKLAANLGGQVDGGIKDEARSAFYGLIFKIREGLGAKHHAPDPAMGVKDADLVFFSLDKLLSVLASNEVQQLFDQYKFVRDRAEFVAVGRQREFDEAFKKSVGSAAVAQPVLKNESGNLFVRYGVVPEEFVPPIKEALSGDVQLITYEMKKSLPGSLDRMIVTPSSNFAGNLAVAEQMIFMRDLRQSMAEKAVMLACEYRAARGINRKDYWYKTKPPVAADAAALRAKLANHPFLKVGEPRETCPASFDEAK